MTDKPTRGIILLGDRIEEVPPYLLDDEHILWPPTMPPKEAGKPVTYVKPDELYRRVRLVEENVYVFVPDNRDPDAVIQEFRARIREWLEGH